MPNAILNPDGTIRQVIRKPTPFTIIAPDERMVDYNPPEFDAQLADLVVIEPVLPGEHSVRFEVAPKPQTEAMPILRERKWAEIKLARDAAEFGGFVWDGSTFDSDRESVQRIGLALQYAAMAKAAGLPASVDWTLADNTTRTLNADDMLGVGSAMTAHIGTQHAIARALRAQIDAAATPEEINNINW